MTKHKSKSINLVDLQAAFAEANNIRRPVEPAFVVQYFLNNDSTKVEITKGDDGKDVATVHIRDKREEKMRVKGGYATVVKFSKWRVFHNAKPAENRVGSDYTLISAPLHAWFAAGFEKMIERSAESGEYRPRDRKPRKQTASKPAAVTKEKAA